MANVKYEYQKLVNSSKLYYNINQSSITIALYNIITKSAVVEIWFKTNLSDDEKTILDDVVANTDNAFLPDENPPVDLCNKPIVHETSKPYGLITTFTSQGDDKSNPDDIGGGELMKIDHVISVNDMEQSIYVDFNNKKNRTDIHEGYITWRDAEFDQVSMHVVPTITQTLVGTGTNFNLYNGIFIIPAAPGTGTLVVNPEDMKLVEMTVDEDIRKRSPGFWNADYNPNTNVFSNITPAPDGSGIYNMFSMEICLGSLVNKALFDGSGFLMLQTADSKQIAHGMRIKLMAYTNGEDHTWKAACILTLHREKTA